MLSSFGYDENMLNVVLITDIEILFSYGNLSYKITKTVFIYLCIFFLGQTQIL